MKNSSNKNPRTRMTLRDAQTAESKTGWQRLKDMPDTAATLAALRALERGQAADNPAHRRRCAGMVPCHRLRLPEPHERGLEGLRPDA